MHMNNRPSRLLVAPYHEDDHKNDHEDRGIGSTSKMSFINENKLIFGAVGIALSSAAVGYAVSHFLDRRRANAAGKGTKFQAVTTTATVDYFMKYGIRESPPLSKLREVSMKHPRCRMICSADECQLMRLLVQLVKAKKVIEIGVFTGYNTLSMAIALPPDGKVVACDMTDMFMKDVNAQQYFKEAGVESKIDLRLQPALTTLDELIAAGESGTYDLIFIDADKINMDQYYEKSLQLLRKGGLAVLDNTLWSLRVCNPEVVASDEETRAIHNLNMKVHQDSRVDMCFLSIADGVIVALKL